MLSRPCFCTREQVKRAIDIYDTARANEQIDRLMASAADSIEEDLLNRHLVPIDGSRDFRWPDPQSPTPWRLWLNDQELVSVTSVVSGYIVLDPSQYLLYPLTGPPYDRIEINLGTTAAFSTKRSYQNSITVVGTWSGVPFNTLSVGTITDAVVGGDNELHVSNGALIGVGDLIVIGNERMIVDERGWLDVSQQLQTSLSASAADNSVSVVDGSVFNRDEILLVGGERMLIVDIVGNSLIVRRAWDGSTLTSHSSGAVVYASRVLSVQRGKLGTTATTHGDNSAINRWMLPSMINQLAVAETLNSIQQERSSYARVIGSGDNTMEAKGMGLEDIRCRVAGAFGRKARTRVV